MLEVSHSFRGTPEKKAIEKSSPMVVEKAGGGTRSLESSRVVRKITLPQGVPLDRLCGEDMLCSSLVCIGGRGGGKGGGGRGGGGGSSGRGLLGRAAATDAMDCGAARGDVIRRPNIHSLT